MPPSSTMLSCLGALVVNSLWSATIVSPLKEKPAHSEELAKAGMPTMRDSIERKQMLLLLLPKEIQPTREVIHAILFTILIRNSFALATSKLSRLRAPT